jgi:hypothetical protein
MMKTLLLATTTIGPLTAPSPAAEFHFGDVLSFFQSCLAESAPDGAMIREKAFTACVDSLAANGPGGFGDGFQVNSAGLCTCIKRRQPTILRDSQVSLPAWDHCVSKFVKTAQHQRQHRRFYHGSVVVSPYWIGNIPRARRTRLRSSHNRSTTLRSYSLVALNQYRAMSLDIVV